MNTLVIIGLITILIAEIITVAIVIAWEFFPVDCAPVWFNDLYYFITGK
jgi:hypothetical protein